MVERIKTIMAHYQLRAAQFSDAIGMQRSAVSHVLSGRNKPSLDFVLRIKRHFPEISLDWLTLGEGDMLPEGSSAPVPVPRELAADRDVPEKSANAGADNVAGGHFSKETGIVAGAAEVRDEEQAYYGTSKPDRQVIEVLFFYDDGTFRAFKPGKQTNGAK